jgi:hypothetical protein
MAKKQIPTDEIPEVVAFEKAKMRLLRTKEAYPEVFEQLAPLIEDYNDKLEAAGKAVASRGVDCGDFTKLSEATTFDADKLYEIIGHDKFLTIGSVATKQVFTVNKKKAEIAILNGVIPEDAVDEVRKITPRYSKPKPMALL